MFDNDEDKFRLVEKSQLPDAYECTQSHESEIVEFVKSKFSSITFICTTTYTFVEYEERTKARENKDMLKGSMGVHTPSIGKGEKIGPSAGTIKTEGTSNVKFSVIISPIF